MVHPHGQSTCTIVKHDRSHYESQWGERQILPQQDVPSRRGTEHKHAKAVAVEAELIGHQLQQAEENDEHPRDGDKRSKRIWNT